MAHANIFVSIAALQTKFLKKYFQETSDPVKSLSTGRFQIKMTLFSENYPLQNGTSSPNYLIARTAALSR